MINSGLAQRLRVIALLLPAGLVVIYLGGWIYFAMIALFLALAAWEYIQLFKRAGHQPAAGLVIGGVLALCLARAVENEPGLVGFTSAPWLISLLVLLAMAYHLFAFERGRDQAGSDFAITLAGILYLGWIGAYFLSLRYLPHGLEWFMLVIASVWLADGGAYLVGSRFGRHKLSPRLSPKKTWEGYLGGICFGVAGAIGLAWLLPLVSRTGFQVTIAQAAWMGLVMSVLPTLGDLGESMIKRQAGVKDSSNLLPGHGGMFDRIDSWLWGVVIGYYVITWLF